MPRMDDRMRWALSWATLAAGIALRDCVVIAAAGPLALWAFYSGMDDSAPLDAFRAAIRSAMAGASSILAAIALAIVALAAVFGTGSRIMSGCTQALDCLPYRSRRLPFLAEEKAPPRFPGRRGWRRGSCLGR